MKATGGFVSLEREQGFERLKGNDGDAFSYLFKMPTYIKDNCVTLPPAYLLVMRPYPLYPRQQEKVCGNP